MTIVFLRQSLFARTFPPSSFDLRNRPFVELHVDAAFGHLNAFGFEEFSLQGSIGLAD